MLYLFIFFYRGGGTSCNNTGNNTGFEYTFINGLFKYLTLHATTIMYVKYLVNVG